MCEFFAEGYQEAKQEAEVKKQYMYCGRANGKSMLELTKLFEKAGMMNELLPIEDKLVVSFTHDPIKGETGICVARNDVNGRYHILKMLLDEEAKELYKIITDQTYGPDKKGDTNVKSKIQ